MKFKEKRASKNKAIIYLRYLDNTRYLPLLRVWDLEDNLLLEKDLPETSSFDAYGEIQLSVRKVTIKPRKNSFSKNLKPIDLMLYFLLMICVKNYTYPQQGEALLAQITDKACDFTGFVSGLSYTLCSRTRRRFENSFI